MLIRTKRKLKKWMIFLSALLAAVLLCYVNIRRLGNNIYSNYEKAVEYGRVRENKEFIEPVIAAVFYKGRETQEKNKNVSTYLDHFENYKKRDVKIIVVPPKLTENSTPVVEKLYEEISKYNEIKKIALVVTANEAANRYTELLQRIIKPDNLLKIILNESDISAEKKVEECLSESNTLVVAASNLSYGINGVIDSDFLSEEIIWLAQKYAYKVHVFDALDTKMARAAYQDYESLFSPAISKEESAFKKQKRNLQKYVNQYENLLLKYFKQNLLLEMKQEAIFPAKNAQTYRLYDRGAVYIRFFGANGKEIFSRAKVGKNKGVIVSVVELARKAVHKIRQPIKSFKIYLFTDFEELEWNGDSLVNYLETDDGVYIQYKDKKALMVADERPQNQDEWLAFLFSRAGVPQKASYKDIKLFKFKTVEIEDEN